MIRRAAMVLRILAIAAGAFALGAGVLITSFGRLLILNTTSSEPIGMYVRVPGAIHRGDVVAGCLPRPLASLGRRDGYLASGPCPGNAPYVVKRVVGTAGDRVSVTLLGVNVDGSFIPHSARIRDTAAFRQAIAPGTYTVLSGEYWLASQVDLGWDSRYYGPVPLTNASRVRMLR